MSMGRSLALSLLGFAAVVLAVVVARTGVAASGSTSSPRRASAFMPGPAKGPRAADRLDRALR
jgi:hypothetical protein